MESGVHGVESEAAVCPGRRISGVSASRWTSCGAGTGAGDTLEGVAGITIPPEQPQSLPKALLRHPTVRYRARRPPRRSPGLAHFVIPRPGLRQTPSSAIQIHRGADNRKCPPGAGGRAGTHAPRPRSARCVAVAVPADYCARLSSRPPPARYCLGVGAAVGPVPAVGFSSRPACLPPGTAPEWQRVDAQKLAQLAGRN